MIEWKSDHERLSFIALIVCRIVIQELSSLNMALLKPSRYEDVMDSDDCDNVEGWSVDDGEDVDMMNANPNPLELNEILSALTSMGTAQAATQTKSSSLLSQTRLDSIVVGSIET